MFYGSLQLARQLKREKRWIPGVWSDFPFFDCAHYYAFLGSYLLNQDYIMLPQAEFKRRKLQIFQHFAGKVEPNSDIFARPTSGFKGTFSGKLFEYKHFEKDWEWVEEDHSVDSMVVIASAARIGDEWRFMVAGKEIVGASRYKKDGKYAPLGQAPTGAYELAKEIAEFEHEGWEPEPMWVLDIGESGGEYHLIEINSFSCSGWYLMPPQPIVRAAKELALKEWQEIQGTGV
jgi:hypothetical protein